MYLKIYAISHTIKNNITKLKNNFVPTNNYKASVVTEARLVAVIFLTEKTRYGKYEKMSMSILSGNLKY